MTFCKDCGSAAINEHHHGRVPGVRSDLCDVCYWREIAKTEKARADELDALRREAWEAGRVSAVEILGSLGPCSSPACDGFRIRALAFPKKQQ